MYAVYAVTGNVIDKLAEMPSLDEAREIFNRERAWLVGYPGESVKLFKMLNSVVFETIEEAYD